MKKRKRAPSSTTRRGEKAYGPSDGRDSLTACSQSRGRVCCTGQDRKSPRERSQLLSLIRRQIPSHPARHHVYSAQITIVAESLPRRALSDMPERGFDSPTGGRWDDAACTALRSSRVVRDAVAA